MNLCSLLFYKRLSIFDVLHLYSIVKAQQNLHNDICALLGLMGVFAMGLAYRGRKDEGWSYDEWLWLGRWVGLGVWEGGGLGGAVCVWCWDSVGKAVDVPTQRYSTYPHPIPIQHQVFPTYRIRTARQTPLSPPSTNSHPPYLPYIHPTQLHSRVNSTPTNPTRPSTISKTLRTLSHKQTHPTPCQPDPLPHLNPTQLPHHTHPIYYRTLQTLTPPTPICPPRRNDSHQS